MSSIILFVRSNIDSYDHCVLLQVALFIIHGALRNSEQYFCSFKKLMRLQSYRKFEDVLIITPDFSYEHDSFVHPNDAFWNSTKPWGDWRVGAESDPNCCGNRGNRRGVAPRTISSFTVLDNFLAMLTDRNLFPHMDKISFVGHSAGAQTVQRYAMISPLAGALQTEVVCSSSLSFHSL